MSKSAAWGVTAGDERLKQFKFDGNQQQAKPSSS